MLAAGAYSFRQQSRLAISLSWIGGFVNVVALMATAHAVSHTTGNTTSFAQSLAQGHWHHLLVLAGLLGCFLLGAMMSAAMTEGSRRKGASSSYMLAIAAEAMCLLALAILLHLHHDDLAIDSRATLCIAGLGSLAMGLQNATITRISGSVVRTTHLTGVFTDLGIESVRLLLWWKDRLRSRGHNRFPRLVRVSIRNQRLLRTALFVSIIGSFAFGAMVGAWLYVRWPGWAMALPVLFLLGIIYMDWRRPIADVRMIDPLQESELASASLVRGLLPPEIGLFRLLVHSGRHHRAPNFQKWATALPRRWAVVVLALSPMTALDTNAAIDLRLAIEQLQRQGRHLVLSGLTRNQARTLMLAGLGQVVPRDNLCADLPEALARAMAIHKQLFK